MKLVSAALFSLLLPTIAAAQGNIFIQAGPVLDMLQESSLDNASFTRLALVSVVGGVVTPDSTDERSNATRERFAPGGFFTLGVFVSPSVSLRVETSILGNHVSTEETSSVEQGTVYSSRNTSSATDISVAAGWHQGKGRTRIGYLAGIVFRRQGSDTFSSLTYPTASVLTVGGRLVQVIESETEERTYNTTVYNTGIMAGVDVAVDLSAHLSFVPQLRLVGSSYSWNVRPAVSLRWRP
jgi:hypothetical protein